MSLQNSQEELHREKYKKIPPGTIKEFRNLQVTVETIAIPEIPQNRKCTDIFCLIFFAIAVLLWIILTIVFCTDTNISRFFNGVDGCGNICNYKNAPVNDIKCSGQDTMGKSILLITKNDGFNRTQCVNECPKSYILKFGRCLQQANNTKKLSDSITNMELYKGNFAFRLLFHTLKQYCTPILIIWTFGLVCCYLSLLFLYFNTIVAIWSLLIFNITVTSALASFYLYIAITYEGHNSTRILICIKTAVLLFVVFVGLCVFCIFYKRRNLIGRIFTEAMKAIAKVPSILLPPILTILFLIITAGIFSTITILVSTKEKLEGDNNSGYKYVSQVSLLGYFSYTFFMYLWLIFIANGCQHTIIAGAAAAWYFSRSKDQLQIHKPLLSSFYVTIIFHMGSIVFGSFILVVLQFVRMLIKAVDDKDNAILCILRYIILTILSCIQEITEYLTKKAYIQIAMHGKGLCMSGKRAARLIWLYFLDMISLDVVTYHILNYLIVIITLLSVAGAVYLIYLFDKEIFQREYFIMAVIFTIFLIGIMVYFIISGIKIVIETIFICYCEDKLLNDGISRPYFMSKELQMVMDDEMIGTEKELKERRQRKNCC